MEFVEGRGCFDLASARSSLDAGKAQQIVLLGQKALADCLAGREGGMLAAVFRRMPLRARMLADEIFVESQDALQAQVNPLLVLDTMAARLHVLAEIKFDKIILELKICGKAKNPIHGFLSSLRK